MINRRLYSGIGAAIGMLILILDGKTALSGASEGIDLCVRTVIPALFPFFVLSSLMSASFLGTTFPISLKIFGVPRGAESLVAAGFLGGYPVGARNIGTAYTKGYLPKEQAERMLGFCSNAGPSFLFGMIAPLFPGWKYPWILWAIHILSALIVGILLPHGDEGTVTLSSPQNPDLTEAVKQSISAMASVCGWIILFRIIISFLDRWVLWLLPAHWQVAITGLLELSNGCCGLKAIENLEHRFIICSGMLAFGGLCVTMQTRAVTRGLSLGIYFPGKLLQCAISILLSGLLFPGTTDITGIALLSSMILVFFLRKMQNSSSNLLPIGV